MANKKVIITTPTGTAVYPHLLEPDSYQLTEYGKQEFNTKLQVAPSKELTELLTKIKDAAEESHAAMIADLPKRAARLLESAKDPDKKAKAAKMIQEAGKLKKIVASDIGVHYPFEMVLDEDGDATGEALFKFKCASGGTNKKDGKDWEKELPLFDANKQKIEGAARNALTLWGGSQINVMAEVITFDAVGLKLAGVSLRLVAVQVIKPVGGAGHLDVDDTGFGVVTGGFVQSDNGPAEFAASTEVEDEYVDDIPF